MRTIKPKESTDKISGSDDRVSRKGTHQLIDNRPVAAQQRRLQRLAGASLEKQLPLQRAENKTGLPDQLKSGVEGLSGLSMDPVKVHYNSAKPATVQAHAYAQGTNIHLAPGQEKHLPHETWHVVQQMQGRVKPTTAVNGQAVNDNGGLEREADVMGNKALQLQATDGAKQALSTALNGGAMQRKVAPDLQAIPAAAPFTDGGWAAVRPLVNTYQQIAPDDKVFAEQKRQLLAIQSKMTPLHDSGVDQIKLQRETLEEEIEVLENRMLINNGGISDFENILKGLAINRADLQQQINQQQIGLETTPSNAEKLQSKLDSLNGDLVQMDLQIGENNQGKEDLNKEISNQINTLRAKNDALGQLASQKTELGQHNNNLSAQLDGVQDQMSGKNNAADAKEAEFAEIENTTAKKRLIQNRPAEINALATKFKATTDDNARFTIALEMQDRIDSWKAKYVAGGQIKATYQGTKRQEREAKYESIKLIEEQLGHTLRELSKSLFPANGFGGDEEGTSSLKTAFDTGGAILEEGSSDTGRVTETFESQLSKGAQGIIGASGSGADGLIQIQKLINIAMELKEQGWKDRFLSGMEALDSLGTGVADASKVANAFKGGKLEGAEDTALWSEGLAQAIGGLRSAILGVISIVKALQKRKVDVEHAWSDGFSGGVSLLKAAESAAKAAKTFFDVAEKTVPPALMSTIPALGIAVNAASAGLSVYQGYQGRKQEKGMKDSMDAFLRGNPSNSVDSLVGPIGMIKPDLEKITHVESRGVFGQAGGKKYLRFNAYVMAKIEAHDWNTGNLTINIGGGKGTVTISKGQARLIREYEYISKMTEINQKRKIKGGSDAILSLVSMGGDIATLSGVGALVGTPMKAAVGGAKLVHTVAKGGESLIRNRQRATLDKAHAGGVASIPDQATYDSAFPTDWGRSKVDKSSKQKETEYRRHAAYVLERISLLPEPNSPTDYSNVTLAYEGTKKMISASGVDYYDFLNAKDLTARFKLLVSAQKSGR